MVGEWRGNRKSATKTPLSMFHKGSSVGLLSTSLSVCLSVKRHESRINYVASIAFDHSHNHSHFDTFIMNINIRYFL